MLSGGGEVVELSTTPDAPTWLVAPYASGDTSSYSISMAVLPVSGLEYRFHNVTTAGHDSVWQSDVIYVDKGLSADTSYAYEVQARNQEQTEGDYSTQMSATTFTVEVAAVMQVANEIRTIETYSNPNNPGKIVQALIKDGFPNPNAANDTDCEKSDTNGLAAYPGDLRNTPNAFQVDLANIGVSDIYNPNKEQFGIWHEAMAMFKDNGLFDTQFAFSKSTLKDFFGITVNDEGQIKEIGVAAASVFLHDDALAYSTTWDSTDNQLIDLHIDAFRSEQLSLYLAGRDAGDARVRVVDPRTSPANVMYLAESLQYQVVKSYMYAIIKKYQTNVDYRPTYDKIATLFGAEFDIKSSQNALGVAIGDQFKCHLNDLFLLGGAYVRGEVEVFNMMTAIWEAYQNGTATWLVSNTSIVITRTSSAGQLTDAKFSFSGTPQNVDASYPSILHYSAVMSALPAVDFNDRESWGVVEPGTTRTITTDADLGYERLSPTNLTTFSESKELTTGGLYSYTNFESGQKLTLKGDDAFMVIPTTVCTITADGYITQMLNQNQRIPQGRKIDISDFVKNDHLSDNAEDIFKSSFYGWWVYDEQTKTSVQHMARVNDPAVPDDMEMSFYFMPAAREGGPEYVLEHIGDVWDTSKPWSRCARITVANADVLGHAATAQEWADNFSTYSSGTGVIDASQTTGDVLIIADNSIQKILLGSGKTTVIVTGVNASQKTYVLNADAEANPTLDIRSDDVIDWSNLTQGLEWNGGTAATYDNKATDLPYLRCSYYADWSGTQGSETEGAFQAIVHANGNTRDTDDPVEIVKNALDPLKVTIDRATVQTAQTSASLMTYTVVFSEVVSDFDESDVTLSGSPATVEGASVVVTNPSGDQITYTVAVTLKDTASPGNVVSTIGAGEVHDAEGFSNLTSTSTYNAIAYVPNTITGQELSNVSVANQGGEPLPGVHVSLDRSTTGFTERTTTTDSDGRYRFENVPDGTYQVTVTPPNACIDTGSNTTEVNAEDSQTYEADFSVGALKSSCIPNRMMVASSLPVGSTQWRQVVQEALDLGERTGSQSTQLNVAETSQPPDTQYLVLGPRTASFLSDASIADAGVVAVVIAAQEQVDDEPEEITQTAVVPSPVPDVPSADSGDVAVANAAQEQADDEPEEITQTVVAPIVQEAITRWAEAGLDQEALNKMRNTTFVLSDLAGWYLGMTRGNTIWLDSNAAGRGWFVDSTPNDDEEFGSSAAGVPMRAIDPHVLDQMDLLTVVSHELGHVVGLEDSDHSDLMGPSLEMGLRLVPSAHDVALASL